MAQFQVYRNPRPSKTDIPFLLDIQSDFVKTPSRVVVPLVRADRYGPLYAQLNPVFSVAGIKVVASVSDLAAVPLREIGKSVADLSSHRADFVAALDFLLSGF
jgi:toxin CcdB